MKSPFQIVYDSWRYVHVDSDCGSDGGYVYTGNCNCGDACINDCDCGSDCYSYSEDCSSDCDCSRFSIVSNGRTLLHNNRLVHNSVLFTPLELFLHPRNPNFTLALNLYSCQGGGIVNSNALRLLKAFRGGEYLGTVHQETFPQTEFRDIQDAAHALCQSGLLASSPFDKTTINKSKKGGVLTAWIHVTNKCNLHCPYCYLTKTADNMEIAIGLRSVDAVIRSASRQEFQGIKLKFAGGESTLNFALIAELHHYAQTQAQLAGLSFQSVILSNGVLINKKIVDFLKTNDVRLMISLDGIGKYHDAQRMFANGRGSFDLVSRNIDYLIQHNIKPTISITLTNRNLSGLPEVVKYVLDKELPFSLNFFRENDCATPFQDLQYDEQQIIEAMLAAFEIIEQNLPRHSLLGSLLDRTNLSMLHDRTCGVGENYMVIDQNGQIAKCQMAIEQPITSINASDPLQIIREDQIGIQNLPVEEKEGCRDCQWRYWCAGGCPLYTHRVTGRYDVKSPNCNIYKALFPEVLRLEGLRLLKYYEPDVDRLDVSPLVQELQY